MADTPTGQHSSRPYIKREITLNNYDAQHLYNRDYQRVSDAFFLLNIILPIIGDAEQTDKYASNAVAELQRCGDDLDVEIKRMAALANENGLSVDQIDYTNAQQYAVAITSPMDNIFLSLIQQLDDLGGLMSILWIGGVFDQKQYRTGLHQWRRRVQRLGTKVSTHVARAMKAARTAGKQSEVRKAMEEQGVKESMAELEPDSLMADEQEADPQDTPSSAASDTVAVTG